MVDAASPYLSIRNTYLVYDVDLSWIIHWQNFASLGGPGRPRSCCFYPKELQGEATIDTAIALAAGDRAVAELPTACLQLLPK